MSRYESKFSSYNNDNNSELSSYYGDHRDDITHGHIDDYNIDNKAPYKEGYLLKKGVFNVSWQRRYFILKDNVLYYYKTSADTKERGNIPVDGCHITSVSEDKYDKTLCFDISSPATNRVFALHADTPVELKEWINILQLSSEYSTKVREAKFKNSSATQKIKDMRSQFTIPNDFRRNTGISLKLSLWRQPVALRGLNAENNDSDVNIKNLNSDDRLETSSCSIAHNLWNCLAVGSNSGRGSVVQLIKSDPDQLKVVQRFRQNEGCVSIDWLDDKLLVGSALGTVSYYKCDELIMDTSNFNRNVFAVDNNNLTASFIHSHLIDPDFSQIHHPPGQWGFSTKIQRVALNPISKQAFIAIENSSSHLWSLDRSDEPIHSEKTNSALFACAWNPHTGTEFMLGGLRRHLKLYDVRALASNALTGQAVVWKANDAHADVIRDIAWNPLMPNWVASVGDDGCAQVFDMRYGSKPLITLQCSNSLYSVNWSNSHSELLVTGGIDKSLKLWNLRLGPHYLVNTVNSYSTSIVSTQFSKTNPIQYFGLSTTGELSSICMKNDLLESMCQHRPFDKVDNSTSTSQFTKIESSLYSRDFATAYELIAKFANTNWDQGKHDLVGQLLKLANSGLFHGAVDDVPPKSFVKLVQDVAYYYPPNAIKYSEPLSNSAQDIQLFKLRVALIKLTETKKFEDIFSLENEIIGQVERSSKRQELAFDANTLQKLLAVLLPYDYLRAVNFAYRLAESYMKQNRFSDFVALARMLLYPTIYHCTDPVWAKEQQNNPQTQAQELQLAQKALVVLERDLRNPKVVLAELELLYETIDKSQQGLPSCTGPVITLLEPHRKVLPQVLHRLFFHSLLAARHYDKFFIFASQLAYSLNGYHFSFVLNQMMEDVGFPKLKKFLDEYTLLDRSKPWDTSKLTASVLTIINIVANCVGLPKALKTSIPDYLKKITLALRQALIETRENPSYAPKHGSGTKDASLYVDSIIEQVNLIQEQKRAVSAYFESQIGIFLQMLQEFK